ncbi:MAG: hypothetical protein ACW98X_22785 [Promethearchaeota archaeon]
MNEITHIEGRLVAETQKAILIHFKLGKEVWIPKSTLRADFESNKNISQMFSIDTWVLEKNKVIVDEDLLVKQFVGKMKERHKENLIAIYGIGSFFDENLPVTWVKNDIDLILVIKSIKNIPKGVWDKRFYPEVIEEYSVFSGFNTLEMYQNKEKFIEFSGANYEWAILEIKSPDNSKLLYGKDIRDQLPDINSLTFDYDDILARGLYHMEKSLREKDINAANELSKAIFKTSFYVCVYFAENFSSTSIIYIGKMLKDIVKIIKPVKEIEVFFEEAITYRSSGQFKTDLLTLRKEFITFLISLLKSGTLHKKIDDAQLKPYLTKFFGGFPYLIRFLDNPPRQMNVQNNEPKIINLVPNLPGIDITGRVVDIYKGYRFTKTDNTKGDLASFLLKDSTGLIRVVVWDDEVRTTLFSNVDFKKNSTVRVINGYIRTGFNDKVELHVGKFGNVMLIESPLLPSKRKIPKLTKPEIAKRLKVLDIEETKVSKTPCHFCGMLCSPQAKRCPKCGEPLVFEFD